MATATSTLAVHKGGRKVSRQELASIEPTLPATRTFKPIPHGELIDTVDYALQLRGFEKTREEFAVSANGAMVFAVMDLALKSLPGVTAALGIHASNNKKLAVKVAVGMRVFCCDNLSLASDGIALKKKHTVGLNLREQMVSAVDTFSGRYLAMETQVEAMQHRELSDQEAKALMFDAFRQQMLAQRFLPAVAKEYFEPKHVEFEPRTAWSLINAFTEVLKTVEPLPAQEANFKISRLLGLTSTAGAPQPLVIDTAAVLV